MHKDPTVIPASAPAVPPALQRALSHTQHHADGLAAALVELKAAGGIGTLSRHVRRGTRLRIVTALRRIEELMRRY